MPLRFMLAMASIVLMQSGHTQTPAAFSGCAKQNDNAKRLECYDRATGRMSPSTSELPHSAQGGAGSKSGPASTTDRFGFRGTVAREELAKLKGDDIKEISAVITALSTRPRGEYNITLDNGQEWLQKTTTRSFSLSVGDKVTLKQGAMSAMWLISPKGRSTQVTRVK